MTFLLIPFKVALKGRINESKSAKKNSDRVNYFFKQLVRITNELRSIENKGKPVARHLFIISPKKRQGRSVWVNCTLNPNVPKNL